MTDSSGERGFTMIEALVALTVFGMIAAAVQLGLSATWRNARIAERQEVALLHAKRLLAEAGSARPLIPGSQTGSIDEAMQWRISVEPLGPQAGFAAVSHRSGVPAPYRVDIVVSWRDIAADHERSVSLRTVKIGQGR